MRWWMHHLSTPHSSDTVAVKTEGKGCCEGLWMMLAAVTGSAWACHQTRAGPVGSRNAGVPAHRMQGARLLVAGVVAVAHVEARNIHALVRQLEQPLTVPRRRADRAHNLQHSSQARAQNVLGHCRWPFAVERCTCRMSCGWCKKSPLFCGSDRGAPQYPAPG